MTRRAVAAAVFALVTVVAAPAWAACVLGKMAELPVTMAGVKPLVPAKVNGQDEMFVADSGAFFSTISPTTATELKLPKQALPFNFSLKGVGGEDANAMLATVKTLTLAGVPVRDVPFIVAAGAGSNVAIGLFGQNVWGLADVEYDLTGGAIRLFKPKDCAGPTNMAYWAGNEPYSVLPIHWPDSTNPHTIGEAFVNGVKITVVFDTGAGGSVLTREAAQRIGIDLAAPGVQAGGLSYGMGPHALRTWIAPVASFKIGEEEIRNTRLRVADFTADDIGGDMLLGADFFLSHRVYVANGQHKLYFTYNGGPVFQMGLPSLVQDGPDGKPKAAQEDLGAEPKDADGYLRRGEAFAARREFDRAIADFDKACELAPTDPKAFFQRAMAHAQNRQPALAMADLDQTLKLDPKNLGALVTRGELRIGERDKAGAADLDAAAALAPKEADLRLGLAGLYTRAELFQAAIGQFDLWISSHAGDGRMAEALNSRCWARAALGQDLNKALDDCNRALGLAPKTAAFLDSRGLVRLRLGDNDRAIADYDAALAIQPKLAWSLYGRGLAKLRKGMKAEGDADIAAARALNARLPDTVKRYGVLAAGES